jgi:hypothetical protein
MGSSDPPLDVQEARSLAELREDWTRLAELDGDIFKTWEWARAVAAARRVPASFLERMRRHVPV